MQNYIDRKVIRRYHISRYILSHRDVDYRNIHVCSRSRRKEKGRLGLCTRKKENWIIMNVECRQECSMNAVNAGVCMYYVLTVFIVCDWWTCALWVVWVSLPWWATAVGVTTQQSQRQLLQI